MKYELTKDLETGNVKIDSEHRELFAAVNAMMDACASGKGRTAVEPTMKFLLSYVDKHFAHEVELQEKSNYPNRAAHKQFHTAYAAKLRELAMALPEKPTLGDLGSLNQHIAALLSHIRTEDKRLGAFLKETV